MTMVLKVMADANFFSMDLVIADDDCPKAPNPADDSLSSAQSRRYWREQGPSGPIQRGSSEGALIL